MSAEPTLPGRPYEHPALDYAFLRAEGIRHLEGLAGHVWSDFNTHDPGITILEQVCYAITDLGYRATHSVPDLLASAGGDPYESLYSARTILTSDPVTSLDLRKLVLDVSGVRNAWVEEIEEPSQSLHYHEGKDDLRFRADPPYTTPVVLRGRTRVLVETSDLVDRPTQDVMREVAERLHAHRPACTDFEEIRALDPQLVQVIARVEVGPVDDARRVLADIYERIDEHVAPSVRFETLAERLAAGKRADEIFEGPRLAHGFVDDGALAAITRKDALHTSDLIREIMAVPGVRGVRSLGVSAGGATLEPWSLPLDRSRTPRLDLARSKITLVKGKLATDIDPAWIKDELVARRRRSAPPGGLAESDLDFTPPAGTDRHVARYRSIQYDLPAIYGVGAAGIDGDSPPRRRAQQKQLKAYLLFFDQLLATLFAQLGGAGALFSFFGEDTRTYFTKRIADPALGLDGIRRGTDAAQDARLAAIVEDGGDPAASSDRRNRFQNHLMARFAEQFTDYSLVLFGAARRGAVELDDARTPDERLVPDKQAFLRSYPRIGSARGTGRDVLAPFESGEIAGLAERVERKLGLAEDERFRMVEHLLLAPLPVDDLPPGELEYQQIPFLVHAASRDPFSLQVSFVFPKDGGRLAEAPGTTNELRLLVEHTVREETPAHVIPYVHWLDAAEWQSFQVAHAEWVDAHRAMRARKLGLAPDDDPRCFEVRDARDRLIDLLRIGDTFPLRDLPVLDEGLLVPFGQPAKIPVEHSQRDVTYELRSELGAVLAAVQGNGDTILLPTPPIRDDTTYSILARKVAPVREVYLVRRATVKVGLDTTLRAQIEAELLDPTIEAPAGSDARIVAWGSDVKVTILASQEGVDYHVVRRSGQTETALSADVRGDLGDIALLVKGAQEDVDLRIRATKTFDPAENRPPQTALLDIVLPLKVRARRDLAVALEPGAIVDFGANATVRVDGTQASASYSVYVGPARDADFVFGSADPALLGVDVPGEPRVTVIRPKDAPIWEDLPGFQEVGSRVPGNGGTIKLPVSGVQRDGVILVRAWKQHAQGPKTIASSVQLARAALLLARPDPARALVLRAAMSGGKTTGTLDVTGGQPGVYYHVRLEPSGPVLGLPAYFHKRDDVDANQNKGVGQLRIEVDAAMSRGPSKVPVSAGDLALIAPLSPQLATPQLDAGATLSVRAVKAQTRVSVPMAKTATLLAVPSITAEPPSVPAGSPTKIVVHASAAGEQYQLSVNGQPFGAAQAGNGADLVLATGPLTGPTDIVVLVTRPGAPGIPVERTVALSVTIAV